MSIVDAELTTIAFCWRLERADGVTLGFTSHDRDLAIGDLLYRSAPGMLPSAITLSEGFEADTLDVRGALSSDAISGEDLAAGRWDGAAVALFMADWADPAAATVPLVRGTLGDVSISRNGFEAELRGPTAALDGPVVEQTSPECRAALGDKRCRVDMAGWRRIVRITEVLSETAIRVSAAAADEIYRFGSVRWISGRNCGLATGVAASAGDRLTLRDPPHRPAEPGDLVEIEEGCDKSLATCSGRFGNAINFRGEPYLPGMDLLTRYPDA